MIPLESALAIVDEKIGGRRVPVEQVRVREAYGRIVAVDQLSRVNLPPFDKSVMDGYAVPPGESGAAYRLAGVVSAGSPGTGPLEPGTTVKVMTGAPVPPGTDRVIIVEQAQEENGLVRFENPSGSKNISRTAEQVAVGDCVLKAGSRMGALEISNLINCGITELEVARRVSVALLSTGDELVESLEQMSPGKIMNSNGPLLGQLSRNFGLDILCEELVPDNLEILASTIGRALERADIVVISGGVSMGDFDYVPEAVRQNGLEIHFSRVAVKPGKPMTFAADDRRILFGLPGNPVAVYLAFFMYVLRAAGKLSGGTYEPKQFKIRLGRRYARAKNKRMAFVPCSISTEGLAEPVPYHGSAHLAALMQADGFIQVPVGVNSLEAGAEVTMVAFKEGC